MDTGVFENVGKKGTTADTGVNTPLIHSVDSEGDPRVRIMIQPTDNTGRPLFGAGDNKFPVVHVGMKSPGDAADPTEAERGAAIRELNHDTNGMVAPGKEADALRQANESLINGDMKKFGEALKGLTKDERQHVADAMNQAFAKRGDDTRVTIDQDGNAIVSNAANGKDDSAVRINPDTGKSELVTGSSDRSDFTVKGVSTADPKDAFQSIGNSAARAMQPDIPARPIGT